MKRFFTTCLILLTVCVFSRTLYADEITDWNGHLMGALRTANTGPYDASRIAAIVHVAVFDAVNGIDRRYAPYRVEPAAERGASRRAAAIQAAYVTLVALFPAQKIVLDAKRAVSLETLSKDKAHSQRESIVLGIAWGQKVADAILEWRSTDGFAAPTPPFLGGLNAGQWRPTPPANAPGLGVQFATMTPWVIASPSRFRPQGPPALNSLAYTADFNEVKTLGSISSTTRTADQTLAAFFWNSTTVAYFWDTVAVSLSARRRLPLLENARVLALLNVAMADAAIGCIDTKYAFEFWRPITAINLAADDGNPDTIADPVWQPLFATPPHPDYVSTASCLGAAAATVLAKVFGERTTFTVKSDVMLGVSRRFRSFTDAIEDVKDARVAAGIHFRTAGNVGQAMGNQIAEYVLEHSFR